MKVTFIYPSIADKGFNVISSDMILRPIHHGLCQLSSCLKSAGFDTELIELRTLTGWENLGKKVIGSPIQVAAITMMSPDYPYVKRCAEIIKSVSLKTRIVVGGIHPTIKPEDILQDKNIDHLIRGEGENALISLLEGLEAGGTPDRSIDGTGAIVNDLPFIDRYLFDCLEPPWDFFLPLPYFTIMAGRGCSYNCKFCAPASKMVHGKGTRRRSADSVIAELKVLREEFGMNSFMFNDDSFTENVSWISEFVEKYREAGLKQEFVCQTRADIICRNPKMLKRLARIGLKMAIFGFESGNDRVLKFINKGITVRQNIEAARICRSAGVRIFASYMLGIPTETNEEARDTVDLIRKIRPYRPSGNYFTPLPGSYLYTYCKENGLSLVDDYNCMRISVGDEKPRVKGVDHAYIASAMKEAQRLSLGVRILMKSDKLFRTRRNRVFLRAFRKLAALYPDKHAMNILRLMNQAEEFRPQ